MTYNLSSPTKKTKKSARERSREFALQAIYQWLVNPNSITEVDAYTRNLLGFNKCDITHYSRLIEGVAAEKTLLDEVVTPLFQRETSQVSPIEYGCILLAAFELKNCIEIPYRVIINEYVELTKNFGGSDGFRFVNGVLHQAASNQWRILEAQDSTPDA